MAKKYGRSTKTRSKRGAGFGRKKQATKRSYLKPYKKFAKNVRQIAKKVISSQAEDKVEVATLTGNNSVIGQPAIVPPQWPITTTFVPGSGLNITSGGVNPYSGVYVSPMPPILQGLGQNNRTGNAIRPKKLLLRGVIQTDLNVFTTAAGGTWTNVPINNQEGPFTTHMLVYKRKDVLWSYASYDPARIINTGGAATYIQGTLLTDLYPFNTDAYTIIKHKTFKMQNQPYSQVTGSVTADGWGNGFKQAHTFKVYLPVKKSWKFDDTSASGLVPANCPINDNMYVAFYNTNCDNTPINVAGGNVYSRCTVTMDSVLTFEDF